VTRSANTLRGEAEFTVDDENLVLRPSFDALVAAEQELGPLFAMVERASEGALTLTEISGLLWHCVTIDPRPPREKIGEAVLDCGLVAALKPIRVILAQVLQGRQ